MQKLLIIGRQFATDPVLGVARDTGYHIIVADDAESGLSTLRAEQPEAALLDRELNGGDGLELLKAIRTQIDSGSSRRGVRPRSHMMQS